MSDQINLYDATVYFSIPDIADWPVTTSITQLTMSPGEGIGVRFSAQATWPNYFPPGWDGALQYTLWAFVKSGDKWYGSGFVQFWRDRPSSGAFGLPTWHDDFPANWSYYAGDVLASYHPNPGDQMAFMVSAGDARRKTDVTSVRERSNVVVITLPPGDTGQFNFGNDVPAPIPSPVPPAPDPAPAPNVELEAIKEALGRVEEGMLAILTKLHEPAPPIVLPEIKFPTYSGRVVPWATLTLKANKS